MKKRLFAAFVCLCMIVSLLPTMAFAEAGVQDSGIVTSASGLCEHHTQHDESCGYTEGTAEIPCSHEHDESCGGLTDPEACNHSHDEACGYVPATEGTPCTYVCEICNAQGSEDAGTPSDAQPEECTCETLCTEEEINADCPVCSVEGAELDKVCVGAAPMLPVTALAAGNDSPHSLYVGNTNFASTIYPDNAAYWTSSDGGTNWTSQQEEPTGDSYIYYNGQGTLTLHNANIQGQYDSSNGYSGYGIYAVGAPGSAVSLTIKLEGTNTVSGWSGIFVHAVDGAASLSISGTGSLAAEGTGGGSFSGIVVQGNGGKAELTINNVDVTATNNGAQGIGLQSAGTSPATLAVNGGSLTASGSKGIDYQFGTGTTGSGTPTVTVSNNAIVRANGGISDNSSTDIQIGADSSASSGGIVFDGKNGTVYGDVTLQEDLKIGEGESLTLDAGASLNADRYHVIVDGGTLDESLANSLGNSVKYAPTITTQPTSQTVTEGGTATFTVVTSGTEPLSYQWQQSTDGGQSWTDIGGATNATYTTEATTTSMNGYQYRCVVSNSAGSITSDAVSLTVNEHVHTWGNPVWSWSEDGKTCTVTFTCEKDENHKESPKVDVTSAVKKPATCTETGVTTYTATVEFNGQTYTDTKDVADLPATGHSYDNGKCTVCGAIASDFKAVITAGANGSWQKGTKDGLSFTSNAAFADFLKVQIDGKDLDASNYDVEEGSTIVTLKASYLETLSVGKHTLAIVSETGTAATEFTVKAAAASDDIQPPQTGDDQTGDSDNSGTSTGDTVSPQTGDSSNVVLWVSLLFASGVGLFGAAVYSRKRKYSK